MPGTFKEQWLEQTEQGWRGGVDEAPEVMDLRGWIQKDLGGGNCDAFDFSSPRDGASLEDFVRGVT